MKKFKRIFSYLLVIMISITASSGWTMQIVGEIYDIITLKKIGYWVTVIALIFLVILTIYSAIIRRKNKIESISDKS